MSFGIQLLLTSDLLSTSSCDLSAQFQKTIEEVSAKMDQQGKDYVASLRENERYALLSVSVPICSYC